MDPVTHAVIGISIAKITGNGLALSDAATVGITLGSIFPDIDILLQKWGDYVYLKNHRGITHSIVGLVVSSIIITAGLGLIYHNVNMVNILFWTLLGCLSHTLVDTLNSYGAKMLWPFCKKKFSLSLLIIFDPVFIGTLAGYIFSQGRTQYVFLALFVMYIISRGITRLKIEFELRKKLGNTFRNINILPSMTGLFRWHFILEAEDCHIIGEKNVLRRSIKLMKKLNKLQDGNSLESAIESPVGEFFCEFTPLSHIECEKFEDITRYTFIDIRYLIRNNFLHHAILEVDSSNAVVRASFNPYSINRSVSIPIKDQSTAGIGQPKTVSV